MSVASTLKDALALFQAGDLDAAQAACAALLERDPAHFDVLHLRGLIALRRGLAEEAANFLASAIARNAGNASAHLNYAKALNALKRPGEALAAYEQALALKPDNPDGWNERGLLLSDLGQHDAALASFDEAVARKADFVEAWLNRSTTLGDLGRGHEALAGYERVLALRPEHADARWNMSFCLLQQGDYARGWREHEWRLKSTRLKAPPPNFVQPLWTGAEPLVGKRILIYADQGYGDTLQFCRYIPRLRDLGATVIFKVQRALMPLLKTLDGVTEIITAGDALPPFDVHCSLASLPFMFATTHDTIPAARGYLEADPAKIAMWRDKLGAPKNKRIGLAWSGNAEHLRDHDRSIALAQMLRHLPASHDTVSVQKDVRDSDKAALTAGRIRFVGDDVKDFSDTAALCTLMDVVISVDTSIAHLAGALGKPIWILLPFNPDWRWLLSRSDSPWYTSATLYRQQRAGEWDDVLKRVAADIRRL